MRAKVQKAWGSGRLLRGVVPDSPAGAEVAGVGDAAGAAEPSAVAAAATQPSAVAAAAAPHVAADSHAAADPFPGQSPSAEAGSAPAVDPIPMRIPLAGPRGKELGAQWGEAREWVRSHEAASAYRLEWRDINDRTLGRQRLPVAAWIDTVDDAAALVGTKRDLERFRQVVGRTPLALREWLRRNPTKALEVSEDWPLLVAVVDWLANHPRPGVYLREVDVPGVHTKLIENHRRLIASMAQAYGVPDAPAEGHGWFERRYGFLTKPTMVRFRMLDDSLELLPGISEYVMRLDEAAGLDIGVERIFVVENEINYLSFPQIPHSLVIFGQGNEASSTLAGLPWLSGPRVFYWGDIDTHGFAILDRVRGALPAVESLLMDRTTLMAHRFAWTKEPAQSTRTMVHLRPAELALVEALRTGEFGDRIRLEQERIGWRLLHEAVGRLRG